MQIIYHVENHSLASDFKEIVEPKLLNLVKYEQKLDLVEIKISFKPSNKIKKLNHEVVLSSKTATVNIRSVGRGVNDLNAFDRAFAKFENQLRKHHSRRTEK